MTPAALTIIAKPGKLKDVDLDEITIDGGTQMRVKLDDDTLDEYRQKFEAGVEFPQLVLYSDGVTYWLADGFHRLFAARRAGRDKLRCEVRHGTQRDAILYAVGANGDHGKTRTSADKQKAVKTLIADDEWSKWSNREVARRAHVSADMVDRMRPSLPETGSERKYITKHGTTATMNTANIGKAKPAEPEPPAPGPVSAAPEAPPAPVDVPPCVEPGAGGCGGGGEPDALDRLVQTVGGSKAADPTGPVHDFGDSASPASAPARSAFRPVLPAGQPFESSTQLCVPHDPARAASLLTEKFGREFVVALAAEITAHTTEAA